MKYVYSQLLWHAENIYWDNTANRNWFLNNDNTFSSVFNNTPNTTQIGPDNLLKISNDLNLPYCNIEIAGTVTDYFQEGQDLIIQGKSTISCYIYGNINSNTLPLLTNTYSLFKAKSYCRNELAVTTNIESLDTSGTLTHTISQGFPYDEARNGIAEQTAIGNRFIIVSQIGAKQLAGSGSFGAISSENTGKLSISGYKNIWIALNFFNPLAILYADFQELYTTMSVYAHMYDKDAGRYK